MRKTSHLIGGMSSLRYPSLHDERRSISYLCTKKKKKGNFTMKKLLKTLRWVLVIVALCIIANIAATTFAPVTNGQDKSMNNSDEQTSGIPRVDYGQTSSRLTGMCLSSMRMRLLQPPSRNIVTWMTLADADVPTRISVRNLCRRRNAGTSLR